MCDNGRRNTRSASIDNSALTLGDLQSTLASELGKLEKKIIDNLTSVYNAQHKELINLISKQEKEITRLHSISKQQSEIIAHQSLMIEKLDNHNRRKTAIINGVPETSDTDHVLKILSDTCSAEIDSSFKPVRLGKPRPNKARPIKVKFTSEVSKKKAVLADRKIFHNIPALKNVYVNFDEGHLTSKESNRLRDAKRKLQQSNPGKTVRIVKKRLLLDNVEVDRFDIKNQLPDF